MWTPKAPLGTLLGCFEEAPGALLRAPWSLWDAFSGVWGSLEVLFGRFFLVPDAVLSENGEHLDFDDPLNGFALFLRSQGLQNTVQIDPDPRS